jgi:hypothetical protein
MPAEVFLPGGVYTLGSTLDLRLGTIIVGDPLNRPVIKASSDFVGSTLINGQDPAAGHPETTFMIALKDVILDTTDLDASATFTALQWGIAQGCALTNVEVNMPQGSLGHIGIHINGGSTIAVTDVVCLYPRISLPYVSNIPRRSLAAVLVSKTRTSRSTSRTYRSMAAAPGLLLQEASL